MNIPDFVFEETRISTKKAEFKSLFKTDPDQNLDLFLAYLNNVVNRELVFSVERLARAVETKEGEHS